MFVLLSLEEEEAVEVEGEEEREARAVLRLFRACVNGARARGD